MICGFEQLPATLSLLGCTVGPMQSRPILAQQEGRTGRDEGGRRGQPDII
jgi:hypothetical protein